MDWNRTSFREKLETMWFFHRQVVAKLVVADVLAAIALYYITHGSLTLFPVACVFTLSVINFIVVALIHKPSEIQLPLSLLVCFLISTLATLATGNPVRNIPVHMRDQANISTWINLALLCLFAVITVSVGVATYLMWSAGEMDAEVRRYRANARLR